MPPPSDPAEITITGRSARELMQDGHIRQIRVQDRRGQVLFGAPVEINLSRAVPGIFRAPLRAAACASALVAKLAGLRIVVERVKEIDPMD